MLEKIGSFIWGVIGVVAAGVWISVAVGLMVHLIRFAWSAF
jgi:hypothetical protein